MATPTTPDPFTAMGGGVWNGSGWIPKDNPAAKTTTSGTQSGTTSSSTLNWAPTAAPTFTAPVWQKAGAAPTLTQPAAFQAPTEANMVADPGYQFRLKQGQQALENSASARGTLRGGAQLKALTDYSQGAASQEYQNAYNRSRDVYNAAVDASQAQYGAEKDAFNADAQERQAAFNANFRGAEAAYNPQLQTWQAQNLASQRNAELNFDRAWQQDVFNRDDAFRREAMAADNGYRDRVYAGDNQYRYDVFDDSKKRFLVEQGNR